MQVTSLAGQALPFEPVHLGGLADLLAADLSAVDLMAVTADGVHFER